MYGMDWVRIECIENNFSYFPFLFLHSFKNGIRAGNLNCSLASGSFPFLVSFLSFFFILVYFILGDLMQDNQYDNKRTRKLKDKPLEPAPKLLGIRTQHVEKSPI